MTPAEVENLAHLWKLSAEGLPGDATMKLRARHVRALCMRLLDEKKRADAAEEKLAADRTAAAEARSGEIFVPPASEPAA